MRVKILEDYTVDETPAIDTGTVVEATIDPEYGDAWYDHPVTGEPWFSFPEDFKVLA